MSQKPFSCHHCGVPLPSFDHRPGAWVICSRCGEAFFVDQLASRSESSPSATADDRDELDLDAPEFADPADLIAPVPETAGNPFSYSSMLREQALAEAEGAPGMKKPRETIRHEPDPEPRWFFFTSVFDFPWRADVRGHWILLSIGLILVAELGLVALQWTGLLTGGGPTAESPFGIVVGIAAIFFAALLLGYLAACLMAVLEDTANGCDQIQEWPEGDFRDWMPKLAPLSMAGLVASLAGLSLRRFAEVSDMRSAVVVFLIFPVTLVSMLEAGSLFTPLSAPILKTFFHWRSLLAWCVFYCETGLLTLVLAGVVWLTPPSAAAIAIALYAFPFIAALLIYARLLGRWSWYSSLDHRAAGGDEDEGDDDEGADEK